MFEGVRSWWKKVLVAVSMIGLIVFSGDYAFAQTASSVPEQSYSKPTDKQPKSQPNLCVPVLQRLHLLKISLISQQGQKQKHKNRQY
jgi:hypothetical protein